MVATLARPAAAKAVLTSTRCPDSHCRLLLSEFSVGEGPEPTPSGLLSPRRHASLAVER
jgi:hypothetical protein